jgi:hypothetical protein
MNKKQRKFFDFFIPNRLTKLSSIHYNLIRKRDKEELLMMNFAPLPQKEQEKLNLWLEFNVGEAGDYFDSFEEFLENEIAVLVEDMGYGEDDFDVQVAREALAEWK